MKHFLKAFLIVFFTWLADQYGPLSLLFNLAAGLLFGNLAATAYYGDDNGDAQLLPQVTP